MSVITISLTRDDGSAVSVSHGVTDEQAAILNDAIGVMLSDGTCAAKAASAAIDAVALEAERAHPVTGKIVEGHMGGTYASSEPEDVICEPCTSCGDSDWVAATWKLGDADDFVREYAGYLLGELDFEADDAVATRELLYRDADELSETLDMLAHPPVPAGLGEVDPAAERVIEDGTFSSTALGAMRAWLAEKGVEPSDEARRKSAVYDAIERPATRADVRDCPICWAATKQEREAWEPDPDTFCGVMGPALRAIWDRLPE